METERLAASILASSGALLWDVFLEKSRVFSLTYEDKRVEKTAIGTDEGAAVRAIKNGKTSFAFTNDIRSIAGAAKTVAGSTGICDIAFNLMRPGITHTVRIPHNSMEPRGKIKLLKAADTLCRSIDPRIRQVSCSYSEKEQEITVLNDTGSYCHDKRVYTSFVVQVMAVSGSGRIETARGVISAHAGLEAVPEAEVMKKAEDTARLALRLLEAEKKIHGKMPVVLSSEAGGTMIHEAVGHSLEADLVQKDMSIYKGKQGSRVAAPIITVIDDATIPNKRGSFAFDDEGVAARKKVLIDRGMLKGFIYDRETALKDGADPTGNGRRESYRFRPIPRMTNTIIAPGSGSAEDLIRDTKSGLFVRKMGGGQVNTVTGEFVFEVKDGYMIENGRITYPVRDATMMGTGQEVLNSIDAVCGDLGYDVGTCGKDGQGVPVADGQPTLRIPEILVGSK